MDNVVYYNEMLLLFMYVSKPEVIAVIMKIIDLHCDTIMHFWMGKKLSEMQDTHINLAKLKAGQVGLQCFAIFVPTGDTAERLDGYTTPEAYFDRAYERFLEETEANSEDIRQVFTVRDLEENLRQNRISAMLTVEDAVLLRGNIQMLDDYYRKGVRMVTLTWNYENSLGFPNSPDPVLHASGLKPFGIEAVERMNELGIIVDVSHLSEGGFWDVAKYSRKPFVASHSCARSLCDVSRNLTDDQLRALADQGHFPPARLHAECRGHRRSCAGFRLRRHGEHYGVGRLRRNTAASGGIGKGFHRLGN